MKRLQIYSLKALMPMLLLLLLITCACSQSQKGSGSVDSSNATQAASEKPSIDIHTAAISGDLDAIKDHISAGTDINMKEAMSSSTPLLISVTFNQPEIAKVLIDAGADLGIKNNDGSTALHTAAFFGRIEIVQMLIDAKADKTIKNNFGATPRETVMVDFSEVKPFYDMIVQQLEPMGFALDMEELQEARPIVAMMLK